MKVAGKTAPLVFGIISVAAQKKDYIRALMVYAHNTGRTLYAYHPNDLARLPRSKRRLGKLRLQAWQYQPRRRQWARVEAPAPDVILRDFRNSDRREEEKRTLQRTAVYVNPLRAVQVVKDKLAFADAMQNARVAHPETYGYSPDRLHELLDETGSVFVKHRKGTQGNQILRMESRADGRVQVETYHEGTRKVESVPKEGLAAHVEKTIGEFQSEPGEYILQREVQSPRHEGNKFSVRVIMHRTEQGHVLTGGFASIAQDGSSVANLVQGGSLKEYREVLRRVFGRDYGQVHNDMIQACQRAFRSVEQETQLQSSLPMGELGFDVVFEGNTPHVIEANSRPVVEPTDPYFHRYKQQLFLAGEHVYRRAMGRLGRQHRPRSGSSRRNSPRR